MNKVLAGLALSAGMAIGGSQLVSAGSYPPGGEELAVNVTVVTPNGTVTVTIRGCIVGETVRFTIGNVSVDVTCTAGGGGDSRLLAAPQLGSATATLRVPDAPGAYTVAAVGLSSGFNETTTITVAADVDDGTGSGSGSGSGAGSGAGSGSGSGGSSASGDDASSGLPATGSDTNSTLWIAGGALTAGVALSGVALARRRRPAATA